MTLHDRFMIFTMHLILFLELKFPSGMSLFALFEMSKPLKGIESDFGVNVSLRGDFEGQAIWEIDFNA